MLPNDTQCCKNRRAHASYPSDAIPQSAHTCILRKEIPAMFHFRRLTALMKKLLLAIAVCVSFLGLVGIGAANAIEAGRVGVCDAFTLIHRYSKFTKEKILETRMSLRVAQFAVES
jgi:TRAP-type mannitol/chloroaromatic compound transport system permease large subunit